MPISCFGLGDDEDTSRFIRRLSPMESHQSAQHSLGFYICCVIRGTYAIPKALADAAAQTALEEHLERAVALAILEHPLLRVGLANAESKKPHWTRLDQIDLRQRIEWRHVEDSDSASYEDLLRSYTERQHDTPFEDLENRPGFRIIVIRQAGRNSIDVLFAWDHSNGDGTGGSVFHQTLLEKLNLGHTADNSKISLRNHVLIVPPISAIPTMEQLVKMSTTPSFVAGLLCKDLISPFMTHDAPEMASWAPYRITPNKTRIRLVTIEQDRLQDILKTCRQHHTTLTGLIHAIALVSLSAHLPPEKAQAFQSQTPVSLRRFIEKSTAERYRLDPDRTIANLISTVTHRFDGDLVAKLREQNSQSRSAQLEDSIWAVAGSVRDDLIRKLDKGLKNDLVGAMKFIGDWKEWLQDEVKKTRDVSWEVSNLGVVDGGSAAGHDDRDGWAMERMVFTQSACVFGAAVCLNLIAVKGGSLCISVTWQDGAVSDDIAEGLASDLGRWLIDLGQTIREKPQ